MILLEWEIKTFESGQILLTGSIYVYTGFGIKWTTTVDMP